MQCDKCNNESNIEIFLSNGKESHKVSLCFSCYQKMMEEGLHDMMNGNWDDILNNYFEDRNENNVEPYDMDTDMSMSCPVCHKTIEDIVNDYKYGCDYCASEFEPLVSEFLTKDNNDLDENEEIKSNKYRLEEILDKKHQLEIYIKNEEYENAAILKKEIDNLSKDLGNPSNNDE